MRTPPPHLHVLLGHKQGTGYVIGVVNHSYVINGRRCVFKIRGRVHDLCPGLGVLALPILGVGGGGGGRLREGYYHRANLDILHKKSCIFVHICMILGHKFPPNNAYTDSKYRSVCENTATTRKILGRGHNRYVVPNQSPVPPVSASIMCVILYTPKISKIKIEFD